MENLSNLVTTSSIFHGNTAPRPCSLASRRCTRRHAPCSCEGRAGLAGRRRTRRAARGGRGASVSSFRGILLALLSAVALSSPGGAAEVTLLNVSYDPT